MTILRKYRSIPSLQSINTKIACASIGCLLALPCAAELTTVLKTQSCKLLTRKWASKFKMVERYIINVQST